MCDIACDVMFGHFPELKEMLNKEIEKFRQHGALSPETALSVEDLGLSSDFVTFLNGSPRLLGVFVSVGDNYYFSKERLRQVEERLSLPPLRQWLRHTASVTKGLLRFYVFKLLKAGPMSGSEIMVEVERQSGGHWKPSPGSVYPLLSWLRENGYAEELPREVTGVKRYVLTDAGRQFFDENAGFEDELQRKMAPMGPLFFLRMGICADGLGDIQEPIRRLFAALFDLRSALRENLTEQKMTEVERFLDEVSGMIEEFNKKFRS